MMFSRRKVLWSLPGGLPCRAPSVPLSNWRLTFAVNSNLWFAPAARRKPWSSAVASSCVLPQPTTLPTRPSRTNSTAIAIPSDSGANASLPKASLACKTTRAPADPGAFPPSQRLEVLVLASSKTEDHHNCDSAWTLDELAFAIVNEQADQERFWRELQDLQRQAREEFVSGLSPDAAACPVTAAPPRTIGRST